MSTVTPEGAEFQKKLGFDADKAFFRYWLNTLPPHPTWLIRMCQIETDKRRKRRLKRNAKFKQYMVGHRKSLARHHEIMNVPKEEPGEIYFWNDDILMVTE